jgi:hypothetical protein
MNLLVDMRLEGTIRANWVSQLAPTKLSHNPLLGHLLHEDVKNNLYLGHPIYVISGAQVRNPAGVSVSHLLRRVRLPNDLILVQGIKLRREGRVTTTHLLMCIMSLQIKKI